MSDLLHMKLRDDSSVPTGAVNPLIAITVEHFRNHEGRAFEAEHLWPTAAPVANGGTALMLLHTDGAHVHSDFTISAQGSFEFELFEAPTVTAVGTALDVVCRNYELATATAVTAYHTPTIGANGTRKRFGLVPAGQGNKSGGGSGNFDNEMILKINTYYLLKLLNVSGAAQALGVTWQLYT